MTFPCMNISEPYTTPYTILIDTAEQQPFTFQGFHADADRDYRPLAVRTRWESLGRHPYSLGDYSLDGYVGQVHVERKSLTDCQGTILGWPDDHDERGRRERFRSEMANLASCRAAMVVVEATFGQVVGTPLEHSTKAPEDNAKILMRTILGLQQDFNVPWLFCDGRRMAELATLRFLERFYKKDQQRKRKVKRMLKEV